MLVGIVPFVFVALMFEIPVPQVEVLEPLVVAFGNVTLAEVLGNVTLVKNVFLLMLLLSPHSCRHE